MKARKPLQRVRMNPISAKRRAEQKELRFFHDYVKKREGGRCLACRAIGTDANHVIKRSQGGSNDPRTNGVWLCRLCHQMTDWPYSKGRLEIRNIAPDMFMLERIFRASKWDAREGA